MIGNAEDPENSALKFCHSVISLSCHLLHFFLDCSCVCPVCHLVSYFYCKSLERGFSTFTIFSAQLSGSECVRTVAQLSPPSSSTAVTTPPARTVPRGHALPTPHPQPLVTAVLSP